MTLEELSEPHLVIGEGMADAESLSRLVAARGVVGYQTACPLPPQPYGRTGFGDLLEAVKVIEDIKQVRAIVIAYDNDNDPDGRFSDVQREIRRANSGYSIPNAPLEIAPPGNDVPAIVALPIPWVNEPGVLESMVVPAISEHWPDVRKYVDDLISKTPAKDLVDGKRDKAILTCMVGVICAKDPTCSVGSMWRHKEFKPLLDHKAFDRVAAFLEDLPRRL